MTQQQRAECPLTATRDSQVASARAPAIQPPTISGSSKGFCIDSILQDTNRQQIVEPANGNLMKELYRTQQQQSLFAQQQQQHIQQQYPADALLADYYQRYYANQLKSQRPIGQQNQQAAAAAAAAAAALANSVAMRQLQSFISTGQSQQQQHQSGKPACNQPQQQQQQPERHNSVSSVAGSPTATPPSPNPNVAGAGCPPTQGARTNDCQPALMMSQQQQSMSNLTLDWLAANAGLIYGQQAAAAAAAAAAVSANQPPQSNQRQYANQFGVAHQSSSGACSFNLLDNRELAKLQHQQQQHLHPNIQQQQQPQSQPEEMNLIGQQRVVTSPGFVQPIHHHVVMSPNTIASAAFAGKSSVCPRL